MALFPNLIKQLLTVNFQPSTSGPVRRQRLSDQTGELNNGGFLAHRNPKESKKEATCSVLVRWPATSQPLHQPKPPRRQRQAVPADGGVLAGGVHGASPTSPHPPLHHLHMQRRRRQIHRGQAHIPRRHAYLVIRPDMAIQHKGNAAGIKRCIREIPPPRAGHRHIRVRRCPWRHARQIPTGREHQRPAAGG